MVSADLGPHVLLGSLAVFCLFVQVVTGVLLLAYYRPTAVGAYYSLGVLMDEVTFGWLVHSLHHWSANFLVLFALLHLVWVYFAHAYAAPRQFSWVSGILLVVVVFLFGFSGNLLPWDQQAYWSTDGARQTFANVPLLGGPLLNLLWGGWDLGEEVLLRFYVAHVALLPWLAMTLLGAHLALVWSRGVTRSPRRAPAAEAPTMPIFPDFAIGIFVVSLLAFGVLLTVATLYPPELSGPADMFAPMPDAMPRWYLRPVRQVLRSLSSGTGAIAFTLLFLLFILLPAFDGAPDPTPRRRLLRWIAGGIVIATVVGLGIWGHR